MEDMDNPEMDSSRLRTMCGKNANDISLKADLLQMALDSEDPAAVMMYSREIRNSLDIIETSAAFAYRKSMEEDVRGF